MSKYFRLYGRSCLQHIVIKPRGQNGGTSEYFFFICMYVRQHEFIYEWFLSLRCIAEVVHRYTKLPLSVQTFWKLQRKADNPLQYTLKERDGGYLRYHYNNSRCRFAGSRKVCTRSVVLHPITNNSPLSHHPSCRSTANL